MKPIPRHWATVREVHTFPGTGEHSLTLHGCSDLSVEDAQRDARERLDQLIAAGGPRRRGDGGGEYYPDRRLPEELLEEIHSADGALVAAVTRNRYGAAVLNTDAVLISDIDLTVPVAPKPRGGLLSRLRGRESAEDPDALGLPGPGPRGEQHGLIARRITDFALRHPELGVRSYRTRNGFRLLVTGSGAAPGSPRAQQLMSELHSDELYMILCRVHDTYRARLTPKPWRIDVDRFEHLGTRTAADEAHTAWVGRYRAASQDVAVCRLLETVGPAPDPAEQQIIDLHDRAVTPDSGLPLA